jgi:hypothetical protein
MSANAESGQDPRVGVEELKEVRVLVIESLLGGRDMSPDLLDPVMDRPTGEFALIVPFDIWIEALGRQISQLAQRNAPLRCLNPDSGSLVPECEQPPNQLHVLLRHRPRSIPLAS